MTRAELQRWSREVAEDPAAPSFVALARAYRREGRRQAALDVVLRGLDRQPQNVEAHGLLAVLHVDAGERERAGDEWETVLRLQPDNFEARRGLGFLALERGQLGTARRHLEAATQLRAGEPTVRQAIEVLRRREAAAAGTGRSVAPGPARDPARLFEPLSRDAPFLGALVLDGRGLVLAGAIREAGTDGETLGALLLASVEEARRATGLLGLGDWGAVVLEADAAACHLSALDGGAFVLLATRPDAPAGWVRTAAERARELARRFLKGEV